MVADGRGSEQVLRDLHFDQRVQHVRLRLDCVATALVQKSNRDREKRIGANIKALSTGMSDKEFI